MDCTTYHELITGAVDGELSVEEKRFLDSHLKSCADCRSAYDLEGWFKAFLKERMGTKPASSDVRRIIGEGIRGEAASSSLLERWREFLSRPLVRPAIALGVTAILAIALITRNTTNEVGDVIEQSLASYEAVVGGDLPLQIASSEPAVLHEFFSGKTSFPVIIPEMDDCTLLGGVLETHPDGAMAEVLYDHMKMNIYLYQTSWDNAIAGKGVSILPDVRQQLIKTNCYTQRTAEGRSVVLWRKGSTLCSAVSDLSEADLITCLTSGDPGTLNQ